MMAAAIDERPLPPGWSQKYHEETGRMYYLNHETKTTSWDDPRKTLLVEKADEEQNSLSSLLGGLFNIEETLMRDIEEIEREVDVRQNGLSERDGSNLGKSRGQNQGSLGLQALFSSDPSMTRTSSPTPRLESSNLGAGFNVSEQTLASSFNSDVPAAILPAGTDQLFTTAPSYQSPDLDEIILALEEPEIGTASTQRMSTRDPSGERIPSITLPGLTGLQVQERRAGNPFQDPPEGQTVSSPSPEPEMPPQRLTIRDPSTGSIPSMTALQNTTQDSLQHQTVSSESSPSPAKTKKTTYKPRATLAKGANPSLRNGPDDSLLLMTYRSWEGPDPSLRKGPRRSNVKGPNPINRGNRVPIM